jgi:hypothetical protein
LIVSEEVTDALQRVASGDSRSDKKRECADGEG